MAVGVEVNVIIVRNFSLIIFFLKGIINEEMVPILVLNKGIEALSFIVVDNLVTEGNSFLYLLLTIKIITFQVDNLNKKLSNPVQIIS